MGVGDYVEYLVAEASRLASPPVIVGHSMGGVLAQLVAARLQPRGLVLLSTGPSAAINGVAVDPLRTMAGVTTKWGWWREPTRIDRARALWGIYNEVPADVAEREYQSLVHDSGRVLFQMGFPWADPARATRVDYTRLTMPTLMVVGERDRITPRSVSRATARKIGGRIDYRELPGVGHWLFHEPVVATVAAEIGRFVDRL
jgi:pimeloyl-ACP methyl ester carboxylesterase